MATSKRQIGDITPNGQVLLLRSDRSGTDHLQYVWVLFCARRDTQGLICGHRYGANGSDFPHRICPVCQGGAAGLDIDGLI